MSTKAITATHRLADTLLGENESLEDYVRARRQAGKSWRQITLDLRDKTSVEITPETLRGWFAHEDWAQSRQSRGRSDQRRPGHGRHHGRRRTQATPQDGQLPVD